MNESRGPKLNDRSARSTNRDNLGITSAQTALQNILCPVVNTVTYRAFYWPFLVWNYYNCINNNPKETISKGSFASIFNKEYVKKNDFFFVMGILIAKGINQQNLAGIDNCADIIDNNKNGPYTYNQDYLQAHFGGMQYYNGGCNALGFITDREQDDTIIPGIQRITETIGKPMAKAFENVIESTQYFKEYRLSDKPVPRKVLKELGDALSLDMKGMEECKTLLNNALFSPCNNERFSNEYLIQSRDFILMLHNNYGIEEKPNSREFREILYDWFSPRGDRKCDYPNSISYAVKSWEAVVGRQYFTIAIEIICKTIREGLKLPKTFEQICEDLISKSSWETIEPSQSIKQFVSDCNYDYEDRESLIYEGINYPEIGCENALKILFSVYNRFKERDDVDKKNLMIGEPISITVFIGKIEELWNAPVSELLNYIVKEWILKQNERVAFEKLMQGRDGYLFERVNDTLYKTTDKDYSPDFQGIRLVNLYQIMKDLDYF